MAYLGTCGGPQPPVSMESGLEDRNNLSPGLVLQTKLPVVSMESGLEDRNNSSG